MGQGWPQHHDARFVPERFNESVSGESGAAGEKAQLQESVSSSVTALVNGVPPVLRG